MQPTEKEWQRRPWLIRAEEVHIRHTQAAGHLLIVATLVGALAVRVVWWVWPDLPVPTWVWP